MTPKIIESDSNYDEWCEEYIKNSYKEAAEQDYFLFGDYDYNELWLGSKANDVL